MKCTQSPISTGSSCKPAPSHECLKCRRGTCWLLCSLFCFMSNSKVMFYCTCASSAHLAGMWSLKWCCCRDLERGSLGGFLKGDRLFTSQNQNVGFRWFSPLADKLLGQCLGVWCPSPPFLKSPVVTYFTLPKMIPMISWILYHGKHPYAKHPHVMFSIQSWDNRPSELSLFILLMDRLKTYLLDGCFFNSVLAVFQMSLSILGGTMLVSALVLGAEQIFPVVL